MTQAGLSLGTRNWDSQPAVDERRKKGVKLLTLPILPPLRAILDASVFGKETWLETASGEPQSSNSFGNKFESWCVKAGLPQCNCHGLRKIEAVRAAEAGASEHELMAMFGWDDAAMARVYTRKAAQKKLAASGAAKLNLTEKIVPPSVPPEEKDSKNNVVEEGWCPEEDSNLHGFHHWYLKPARLPIPPSGQAPKHLAGAAGGVNAICHHLPIKVPGAPSLPMSADAACLSC